MSWKHNINLKITTINLIILSRLKIFICNNVDGSFYFPFSISASQVYLHWQYFSWFKCSISNLRVGHWHGFNGQNWRVEVIEFVKEPGEIFFWNIKNCFWPWCQIFPIFFATPLFSASVLNPGRCLRIINDSAYIQLSKICML